jgi:hypothetical protein
LFIVWNMATQSRFTVEYILTCPFGNRTGSG